MRRQAALLILALVLAGCGVDSSSFHDASRAQVKRLQANSTQAVYFAGMTFGGLAVTDAVGQGRNYELVAYGTCSSSGYDAGCAPPIEISESPFKPAQWRLSTGCRGLPSLRGVPTVHLDHLILVTGRQTVDIFGRSAAEDRRLAQALRRVDGTPTPKQLPEPPKAWRKLVESVCPSR